MTISAVSEAVVPSISEDRWVRLLLDLRRRGKGSLESGAFLLGNKGDTSRVTDHVFFDDLDPDCLRPRRIAFHGDGYSALWAYCDAREREVIADIHTHPGRDVTQSETDSSHPMLAQLGHIALIAPSYARLSPLRFSTVGAYLYDGDLQWTAGTIGRHGSIVRVTWP